MAGIYIHIPFCRQACYYCNFHFSTSLKNREELTAALKKEMELRKNYLASPSVDTIYFGGGTPSLLREEELNDLLSTVSGLFSIEPGCEITLEANPDDLTGEKLKQLTRSGINRLSIGIQSFNNADLRRMNRSHNSRQALTCVQDAADTGFKNITIDLMYGLPGQSDRDWIANLEKAFILPVNHLSCYNLTIEERTALAHFLKMGTLEKPDDERGARQFSILMDYAEAAGFEQYEISNFARNAHYSRHNTSYWMGIQYLGIGPSAHSYNGESRQWNIRHNIRYIKALETGRIPCETERLTVSNLCNEFILTTLRTKWGCDLFAIAQRFGTAARNHILEQARIYLENGELSLENDRLYLTRKGKLLADRISSDLFLEA